MGKTYNIGEAAEKIGVSVKTLQRWDRDGKLVANRTQSNRRYYTEKQLNEIGEGENNMCLRDLINVIPNFTVGKIRDKNGNIICEGELFIDCDTNFSEEHLERKVVMVMVDDGKLLIMVE